MDNEYEVYDTESEYFEIQFQGSLADCEAWIRLKEEDIIYDTMIASKFPDGSLKDEEKIVEKYLENWQEEFEDELNIVFGNKFEFPELFENDFSKIIHKYIIDNHVKIKCKDGMIQIERIK